MFDLETAKHVFCGYHIQFVPIVNSTYCCDSHVFLDNSDDVSEFLEKHKSSIANVSVFKIFVVEGVDDYVRNSSTSA